MTYDDCKAWIAAASTKYNVEKAVICAIIEHESGWQNIQNRAGYPAYGLMQVVSNEVIAGRPTAEELLDPATNIDWGTGILSHYLDRSEDMAHAMYYYSGGSYWGSYAAYEKQYWVPLSALITKWKAQLPANEEEAMGEYSSYPRPINDTGAGVHGGANAYHPLGDNDGNIPGMLDEMYAMGLRWIKLLDSDGSSYNACRFVLERGMMPVVRLYRQRPYPGRLTDKQKQAVRDLTSIGVKYFERGNEPNLIDEWQPDQWPSEWQDSHFNTLVEDWVADAQFIVDCGGYPAIDACSPGGNLDDITYLQWWLTGLLWTQGIPSWLSTRAWIAVHNAGLNHPLDYPDDAINQAEHPGQTIHTHYYANSTPTGASNCIRKPEAVHRLVNSVLGKKLPVICTEGGFWPGNAADNRYPTLTVQTASDLQVATLRGMSTAAPYLIAQMPWLWFNRIGANTAAGFERDSWKRIPGWGNCPIGEPAELPLVGALKTSPCQPRVGVPEDEGEETDEMLTEAQKDTVRNLAWNKRGFAYNSTFALAKAAANANAGAPISPEEDVIIVGKAYRWQFFTNGIAIAPKDKWEEAEVVSWDEEG